MWRRKIAVVVPLLQELTASQIAPHSRFAAVRGFPAGPLDVPDFGYQASVGSGETSPSVAFGEEIVDHDGAGNRQIETRHESPLRNLDDEFGIAKELRWDTSELGAENEARTIRVTGVEEIGRLFGELHHHQIPAMLFDVGPKNSDICGQLDDVCIEIGGSCRLDIPLTLAKEDDLLGGRRVRRSNQGADVVFLGDLPSRNGKGAQSTTVLLEPPRSAFRAPFR